MEQHPVPQNISSYEFRLVGDMTLKQFGYLAGGVAVGLFFYALPLSAIIKWPLIFIPAFIGFALAFMPIEERPLATWIVAFIKAIISPTIFIWQKRKEIPEIFAPIVFTPLPTRTQLGPTDKTQLNEYLRSLPFLKPLNKIDQQEALFLQQIAGLFPAGAIKFPVIPPTPPPQKAAEEKPVFKLPKLEKEIKVPPAKVISVPYTPVPTKPVVLPEKPGRTAQPTVKAKQSSALPIPDQPTRPNLIVGMVLDPNKEIIEGAIIEIRNHQGLPVRALKTNKLGQFMIATPLENDIFEIETEKEGYLFDIIKLEVKGEIIEPLEIKAKSAL
jgi:hypothetical protein